MKIVFLKTRGDKVMEQKKKKKGRNNGRKYFTFDENY